MYVVLGRLDFQEPKPLTEDELEKYNTVTIERYKDTKTWNLVKLNDIEIGFVTTRITGQYYKMLNGEIWIPINEDFSKEDPVHAKAVLKLLKIINQEQAI